MHEYNVHAHTYLTPRERSDKHELCKFNFNLQNTLLEYVRKLLFFVTTK